MKLHNDRIQFFHRFFYYTKHTTRLLHVLSSKRAAAEIIDYLLNVQETFRSHVEIQFWVYIQLCSFFYKRMRSCRIECIANDGVLLRLLEPGGTQQQQELMRFITFSSVGRGFRDYFLLVSCQFGDKTIPRSFANGQQCERGTKQDWVKRFTREILPPPPLLHLLLRFTRCAKVVSS